MAGRVYNVVKHFRFLVDFRESKNNFDWIITNQWDLYKKKKPCIYKEIQEFEVFSDFVIYSGYPFLPSLLVAFSLFIYYI